jgi:spore coat polysaccharide biosynthesis predicted glycosyltransferase SpsG
MRVVLRADGGAEQGTGHVMRCLTLAEALRSRGHETILLTAAIDVDWLRVAVESSGITAVRCPPNSLPLAEIRAVNPDWVVVDSYRIPAAEVNSLSAELPVLALVDGDERNLDVQLYLDQNLGAEGAGRDPARYLYGAEYALVRDEVLAQKRPQPWQFPSAAPRILSFMGGSDPTRASVGVAAALAASTLPLDITMIVPERDHAGVRAQFLASARVEILAPTPRLPELLGRTDIVLSAAGTSAWDVCALALPAVLVSVVDNQQAGLEQAVARGLTVGIDARGGHAALRSQLPGVLETLVRSESERHGLSVNCSQTFDGNGKVRVVERLEALTNSKDSRR